MALTADWMLNTHGILLRRCQQVALSIFADEAAELGFSPTQFSVLAFIQIEPGIHQNTLGERVALDRSSVTTCVDNLEARGLIRREVDKNDKRARLLFITLQGKDALDEVAAAAARARQRIEQTLGVERFANFLQDLRAFSQILENEASKP